MANKYRKMENRPFLGELGRKKTGLKHEKCMNLKENV